MNIQGEMVLSAPFARILTFMEMAPIVKHDISDLHFQEDRISVTHHILTAIGSRELMID